MNFPVITVLILSYVHTSRGILDMSEHVKARQKRWLVWRPGINWVQMVVGIGLPIELEGTSVTWGAVLKSYYLLPTNSTQYTDPLAWIDVTSSRKRRQTTRWDLYSVMERFTERPSSTNEMVNHHTDFEYHAAEQMGKTTRTENCFRLFPDCSYSLIADFTKSLFF
ncbi:hypothetical protein MML48_6g00000473 [Holotrichia oblita]|uniref:Uncharacterized protein n=1 Tax=Holotrichia oblita TaxID=644536 RepID=A0ACB9SWU5_HOLOL|nr:hypothetical protein MML48_6g00000473 [Holotrichia oblita]